MKRRPAVRMSILVNDEPVDARRCWCTDSAAESAAGDVRKAQGPALPRHMFKIPIQRRLAAKVVARETISAMRKDVTAKCYGGDGHPQVQAARTSRRAAEAHAQFGKVRHSAGVLHRGAEDRR